jgi:hypothetical protein
MDKRDKIVTIGTLVVDEELTPEMVASMSINAIKEGLREMGLDPNEPLPKEIRQMLSQNSDQPVVIDTEVEEQVKEYVPA